MAGNNAEDGRVLAGMLHVASSLLHEEPDASTLESFAREGLFAEPPLGGGDPELVRGFELIGGWLREHALDKGSEDVAALQREWLRLFVGVGEPEVPSWATYYSDTEHRALGRETLLVRETYRAFGLEAENLNKEPDDSLGLMLRFLAHLAAGEAAAGDEAQRERFHAAQVELCKDHVLSWMARWRYEGEKHARTDFYRGVVAYVFGLVRYYARTLGFSYQEPDGPFTLGKDALI